MSWSTARVQLGESLCAEFGCQVPIWQCFTMKRIICGSKERSWTAQDKQLREEDSVSRQPFPGKKKEAEGEKGCSLIFIFIFFKCTSSILTILTSNSNKHTGTWPFLVSKLLAFEVKINLKVDGNLSADASRCSLALYKHWKLIFAKFAVTLKPSQLYCQSTETRLNYSRATGNIWKGVKQWECGVLQGPVPEPAFPIISQNMEYMQVHN